MFWLSYCPACLWFLSFLLMWAIKRGCLNLLCVLKSSQNFKMCTSWSSKKIHMFWFSYHQVRMCNMSLRLLPIHCLYDPSRKNVHLTGFKMCMFCISYHQAVRMQIVITGWRSQISEVSLIWLFWINCSPFLFLDFPGALFIVWLK